MHRSYGADLGLGLGTGLEIAGGVINVVGRAGIGRDQLLLIVQAVDRVAGDQRPGIVDEDQMINAVVAVLGYVGQGGGDLG